MGVALIDIGGGCTTISIFEDEHLQRTSVIHLGGNHITKDIIDRIRTSTEEAEGVKLNYGHAFYDDAQEEETFEVSVIGSNQRETHNQLEIADIIEASLEEIFDFVPKEKFGKWAIMICLEAMCLQAAQCRCPVCSNWQKMCSRLMSGLRFQIILE